MDKLEPKHIAMGVIVILGIVILYLIFVQKPIKNEGIVNVSDREDEEVLPVARQSSDVNDVIDQLNAAELEAHPVVPELEEVDADTRRKLNWKNKASEGEFVENSFAKGARGNSDVDAWNDFFNENADLVDKSYIQNNDKFSPMDSSSGNLAAYAGKGQTKTSPEDLFKVDKLLPQEVKSDWFEVMPEPIKIKNRHLVNVTRPVGVNTIGSSLKNASYDLRGDSNAVNVKMVVSPWLQSSISENLSMKGLC
jgi:hypothetical protein